MHKRKKTLINSLTFKIISKILICNQLLDIDILHGEISLSVAHISRERNGGDQVKPSAIVRDSAVCVIRRVENIQLPFSIYVLIPPGVGG